MTRAYKQYTDADIINKVKKVKSIAGLLKELKLKTVGGNYYTIKRKLKELSIDTQHWTGRAWNKGERLKDWSHYRLHKHFRKHLIRERGQRCENCKRRTWLKAPIPLEIHHVNGNRTDNNYDNLQLICSNCHSQAHVSVSTYSTTRA